MHRVAIWKLRGEKGLLRFWTATSLMESIIISCLYNANWRSPCKVEREVEIEIYRVGLIVEFIFLKKIGKSKNSHIVECDFSSYKQFIMSVLKYSFVLIN